MHTANKIKRALKGQKLNYVNAEKIAKELGYSVVFFNTTYGDNELERYNLLHKRSTEKGFTYAKAARIIFINGELPPDDRLYVLLHEIGHIALGHIGDGMLMTRNQILIEIEADNFAYSIIHKEKKAPLYFLLASIILSVAIIFSAIQVNKEQPTVPSRSGYETHTEQQTEIQQDTQTDTVYVTPSGTKFHRSGCRYTKNKTLTELSRSEASKNYAPCSVCMP